MKKRIFILVIALFLPLTLFSQEKININTAPAEELVKLKGIGKVKAKRIIEYRQKNGPFKSIEEIVKVKGIGKKTFEKIKDYITVSDEGSKATRKPASKKAKASGGTGEKPIIKFDLNLVSMKELVSVPGINQALAKKILEYRGKKKRFNKLEELKKVPGVTDEVFKTLKRYFYVLPPKSPVKEDVETL